MLVRKGVDTVSVLKQARINKKLTGEQLGKIMGVTRQTINNWESKRIEPTINQMVKLASVLEITTTELFNDYIK